jgi:cytochrome c-type biogenesis protein CcmH/NrfG
MLGAPVAHLPERMARALSAAMAEWQAALGSRLDFPETHLVLGGTALSMRSAAAARAAFREAVTLDPQAVDAWVMLVRIAAATEGEAATRAVLGEALARNPGDRVLIEMLDSLAAAAQE